MIDRARSARRVVLVTRFLFASLQGTLCLPLLHSGLSAAEGILTPRLSLVIVRMAPSPVRQRPCDVSLIFF